MFATCHSYSPFAHLHVRILIDFLESILFISTRFAFEYKLKSSGYFLEIQVSGGFCPSLRFAAHLSEESNATGRLVPECILARYDERMISQANVVIACIKTIFYSVHKYFFAIT